MQGPVLVLLTDILPSFLTLIFLMSFIAVHVQCFEYSSCSRNLRGLNVSHEVQYFKPEGV